MFHTVCCHSPFVSKLFSKLDYCGISLLITSSGIPWLYYAFYCHMQPKRIYLTAICILGIATVLVTMIDSFSTPQWRPYRAGLFAVFGLGGIVPALHHLFLEETLHISMRSFGWLSLMGALYIVGALLYVLRIPERFFPGKFDIWLHSHQLFHVLVIAAALVHLYGILELAFHRLSNTKCITDFVLWQRLSLYVILINLLCIVDLVVALEEFTLFNTRNFRLIVKVWLLKQFTLINGKTYDFVVLGSNNTATNK